MSTNIPNQQSSTSQEDHDRKQFEINKHDLRNQFNSLVFNNTLSPQEDKKDVLPVVSKNIKVRNEKNQFYHKKSPKLGQSRYKYPVNEKNGYDWVDRYEFYYRLVNGEMAPYLEANKPTTDRKIVPERKIFDIIFEEHQKIRHKDIGQTINQIKKDIIPYLKRW